MKNIITIVSLLIIAGAMSCKKDKNFSKNHLNFSTDSLLFDTVFTTVGSTTKRFKIYNKNNFKLNIDEVELMGGASSPFRINLDGLPGDEFTNIEIPGNDSLFCFVEVTLDVNAQTYPVVISDSVRFLTNGVNQYLHLDVWGQDAYFHAPDPGSFFTLVGDHIEPWSNDKPHVLYGLVAVDKNQTLTIPAGTRVYGHKNSQLRIYEGNLNILGELGNEVVFQGDRLESFYDDVAGQWGGIYLDSSKNVTIDYLIVKNAQVALTIDANSSNPTRVTIKNSIFDNSAFYNLSAIKGPVINAENCFFGDAGLLSAYLYAGGEYNFKHCNFVNYYAGSRSTPAFAMTNWEVIANTTYTYSVRNSRFDNCIFYGNASTEFIVDTLEAIEIDFVVNASLIKREEIYEYENYSASVIWNELPNFYSTFDNDFHLTESSPCINAGDPIYSNLSDIEGKTRDTPDIGLYEY